jgi:hypothetical protein
MPFGDSRSYDYDVCGFHVCDDEDSVKLEPNIKEDLNPYSIFMLIKVLPIPDGNADEKEQY